MLHGSLYLGIEFYLFVSYSGMKGRGSMYKFLNARSTFQNLQVDPLSFITPRNKQVEFNPNIYTLSKLFRFGDEISVFNAQHRHRKSFYNLPDIFVLL